MGGARGSSRSPYLSLCRPQQLLSLPVAENVVEDALEDLAGLLVGEEAACNGLVGAKGLNDGVGSCLGQVSP